MISQVIQYKNLDDNYKDLLNATLDPERFVYVIKENNGTVKSITTSVCSSINKLKNN